MCDDVGYDVVMYDSGEYEPSFKMTLLSTPRWGMCRGKALDLVEE